MVGSAVVVLPAHLTRPEAATQRWTTNKTVDRWEVEFSRFFNFPKRSVTVGRQSRLPPLPRSKTRNKGTWIVAETTAVIVIDRSGTAASVPVLSVSVAGSTVEEHFISNIHFSWPQVSCVPQCPIRGSRAVFLSYRDGSGQIQKFAVRFPTGSAAEKFLDFVKECLNDEASLMPQRCDNMNENSSPSEFAASSQHHYRVDDESSFEEPTTYGLEVPELIATCAPEMSALTYNDGQADRSLTPLLANNIDTIFSGLPPSFTDLLTNCSTGSPKEPSKERQNVRGASSNKGWSPENPPVCGGAVLPDFTANTDLKGQIIKYMTDASFQDMLFKIERVIDEMGGDLSLETAASLFED